MDPTSALGFGFKLGSCGETDAQRRQYDIHRRFE